MVSTFAIVFRTILVALVVWHLLRLLVALRAWRGQLRRCFFDVRPTTAFRAPALYGSTAPIHRLMGDTMTTRA